MPLGAQFQELRVQGAGRHRVPGLGYVRVDARHEQRNPGGTRAQRLEHLPLPVEPVCDRPVDDGRRDTHQVLQVDDFGLLTPHGISKSRGQTRVAEGAAKDGRRAARSSRRAVDTHAPLDGRFPVTGTNDEAGLAQAINRFVLGGGRRD